MTEIDSGWKFMHREPKQFPVDEYHPRDVQQPIEPKGKWKLDPLFDPDYVIDPNGVRVYLPPQTGC